MDPTGTVVDALPGTVSMENRPPGEGLAGEGVEHPPPLSRRVTENLSCWITPFQGMDECLAIDPG